MQSYLDALKLLDGQRMVDLLAPSAVSEGADGTPQPVDRERTVTMRGFERAMRTQWSWAVRARHEAEITVSLREVNDFLEGLGAGVCQQTVVYSVDGGKIVRMVTKETSYTGRPYREQFAAFEAWLLTTPAASDPTIVRDGHLLFTAASARQLGPLLKTWREKSGSD